MKPNVDLTESRIFTTYENHINLLDLLKPTKPWDFENLPTLISDDLDLKNSSEIDMIIFTGNKKDRQIKKKNFLYNTEKVCDRCGCDYRKKPWAGMTCNCYSMKYTPKFPWNPQSFYDFLA